MEEKKENQLTKIKIECMNVNFMIAALAFFAVCYVIGVFMFPFIRKQNPKAFNAIMFVGLLWSIGYSLFKLK